MKIIKLSAIGSTNSYLKELMSRTLVEDKVVAVASTQEYGRGQRGATWQSESGKSLTCSLFKRFDNFEVNKQPMLSFVVSLAVLQVLQRYNIPELSVKWPNDIMSRNGKLAGILIENQVQGTNVTATIVGIGLNVNETKFYNLPHATSMCMVANKNFDLDELLFQIATTVFNELNSINTKQFSEVQEAYETQLFRKDMVSVFESNGIKKNGIILGVTQEGELCVAHDGDNVLYALKEVKLLF